jgi:hypothetical protein
MMQHKRRRMLIKAVHDAARELAARQYTTAPLDDDEPMPDEPVIMAFATGPYLDVNPKMLAISSRAIFERVRLTIPNVTLKEVQDISCRASPIREDGGNEKATR